LSLEEVEASTPGSRSIRSREEEEDFATQGLASSNSKSWRERFHCYTARHLRLPFYNECEEKARPMYHELRHLGEGRTVCSALCAERENRYRLYIPCSSTPGSTRTSLRSGYSTFFVAAATAPQTGTLTCVNMALPGLIAVGKVTFLPPVGMVYAQFIPARRPMWQGRSPPSDDIIWRKRAA
jgi:hypothetical protein